LLPFEQALAALSGSLPGNTPALDLLLEKTAQSRDKTPGTKVAEQKI
jgi:hypothetical protein